MDWKDALAGLKDKIDDAAEETAGKVGSRPAATAENARNVESRPVAAAETAGIVQKEPLRVLIDRRQRKGKTATIVEGFICESDEDDARVAEIAKELKQKLGTGGSSRGGEILLQGDWRDRAVAHLRSLGFKVKS